MKRILQLIIILTLALPLTTIAQDTIPDLIFSEARLDGHTDSYFELCNVGDSALDLSRFLLQSGIGDAALNKLLYFEETILEAGETFVVSNIYEEPEQNWTAIQELSDRFIYQPEEGELFESGVLIDSSSVEYLVMRPFGGKYGIVMWYKYSDTDSIIIDCVNWNLDEFGEGIKITGGYPIAGVVEPIENNTLVRKSSIPQGNLGNWDYSRGTDASDSEWLLLEHLNPGLPFRTVKNHGAFPIDVTTSHPEISIDLVNNTLTIPWGIYKEDSLVQELTFGDGMGWQYVENPSFEDSLHTIIQSGDQLIVKATGTELTEQSLTITVSPPVDDMNLVFPRHNINYPDPDEDPPGTLALVGGTPYYVTEDIPGIDTIGSIGFATRVDSLFKYLEWTPDASVKILWVDGTERVDLVFGDKLEVTAKSGAVKEYFIDIEDYIPNDNASITAITWPDITPADNFDFSWLNGDTIPEFSLNVHQYNITLRPGTKNIPALMAYAEDLNAIVEIDPAISLSGGFEERTTTITITSESGLEINEYTITFVEMVADEDFQKFYADPFFSEFQHKFKTTTEFLELCNPGNQVLDMSNYLIATAQVKNPAEAVQADLSFENCYKLYVPGFKFTDDPTLWGTTGYKVLEYDNAVDPSVEPGDVFYIAARGVLKIVTDNTYFSLDQFDITFPEDMPNEWGLSFPVNTALLTRQKDVIHYLFRIENDSILTGDKAIGDMEDLTLIDALGYQDGTDFADIGGYDWPGNKGHKLQRKSSIWKGNPNYVESSGTSPEDSEWTWSNAQIEEIDWEVHTSTLGNHNLDPVTAYISTVSSLDYAVDPGYFGDLNIIGLSNGETVEVFFSKLIKANDSQGLQVLSGADGAVLDVSAQVSEGDSLVVTAEDGKTVTKYLLSTAALDSNTGLVAENGSGITIGDGEISGIVPGTSLETMLSYVSTLSELSILNILDDAGALVPLKVLNFNNAYSNVLATEAILFEVVAQNGDKKAYQLKLESLSSDAFVLSSVYYVDQEALIIAGIPGGTAVEKFCSYIDIAPGATLIIVDKLGLERTVGNIAYDDVIKVTSEDAFTTVSYNLTFIIEQTNTAPNVSIATTDLVANVGIATSTTAIVSDDGLPTTSELTFIWSVLTGDAGSVTFADANQLSTDVTFAAAGDYTLQLIVSDGDLETTANVNYTVSFASGIEGAMAEFKMYPNPAKTSLRVELRNTANADRLVNIINLAGVTVYNKSMENNNLIIDLSSYESGMYFVYVKVGSRYFREKLTIIK